MLPRWLVLSCLAACASIVCARAAAQSPAGTSPRGAAPIRVACLGDSITFGAGIRDRAADSYPAQLQALLGGAYDVRNFGVGGATLLRAADRPYTATGPFAEALAWRPRIAVVVLGTNDSCQNERRTNWEHAGDLEDDAAALVADLKAARHDVRVLFCSPPTMLADKDGLSEARRENLETRAPRLREVAAAVRAVAGRTAGVEYVELGRVLRAEHVTDGVHTTVRGAGRIAARVAEAVRSPLGGALDVEGFLAGRGLEARPEAFHEFAGWSFRLPETGAACRIVAPFGVAEGAPWVLRARFFGHEPALDLALLERGVHLAYCDVADLYGAPAAMARWDEFYDLAREIGLGDKVVLEGMSRGGLPVLGWCARHPGRVAALYLDNPVVDFRSWPGGRSGKRSDADWRRCLEAHGLDEEEAWTGEHLDRTLDGLAPAAAAGVPVYLVLGTGDDVVPPAENGELLAARYRALGGPVEVWRKPGVGHHPHGLDPVDPLLEQVLRAAGVGGAVVDAPPGAEQLVGPGGSRMVPEDPDVECRWTFADGVLTASPAWDSVVTPEAYGDFRLHVEFNVNASDTENVEARGNSGVYIQQRYEIQIHDSHPIPADEFKASYCGSLYRLKKPDRLVSRPAGAWQAYDIVFRAARFAGDRKVEDARITVLHNGVTIHDDVEIPRKTGAGKKEGPEPRPIKLQGHRNEVRFRNVWIERLELRDATTKGVLAPRPTAR